MTRRKVAANAAVGSGDGMNEVHRLHCNTCDAVRDRQGGFCGECCQPSGSPSAEQLKMLDRRDATRNYTIFATCYCGTMNERPITCFACWPLMYRDSQVSHGYGFNYVEQYNIQRPTLGWIA